MNPPPLEINEGDLDPFKKKGGIYYEWGGKDSGFSGYVSGSASDNNGNKAEVEVQVNSDGTGTVDLSVSHEEKTDGS